METTEQKIARIVSETDKNFSPYYGEIPKLVNERGYKILLETGVFCGGNLKAILENTSAELVIGVDPYKMYSQSELLDFQTQEEWNCLYDFVVKRLYDIDPKNRFSILRMDSKKAFDILKDTGAKLELIFLDSEHTYENLKWELENYSTLVKTGGVIALHDYFHPTFPELTKAAQEFAELHKAEIHLGALHFAYIDKTW